jgi:hypothetical protein
VVARCVDEIEREEGGKKEKLTYRYHSIGGLPAESSRGHALVPTRGSNKQAQQKQRQAQFCHCRMKNMVKGEEIEREGVGGCEGVERRGVKCVQQTQGSRWMHLFMLLCKR